MRGKICFCDAEKFVALVSCLGRRRQLAPRVQDVCGQGQPQSHMARHHRPRHPAQQRRRVPAAQNRGRTAEVAQHTCTFVETTSCSSAGRCCHGSPLIPCLVVKPTPHVSLPLQVFDYESDGGTTPSATPICSRTSAVHRSAVSSESILLGREPCSPLCINKAKLDAKPRALNALCMV